MVKKGLPYLALHSGLSHTLTLSLPEPNLVAFNTLVVLLACFQLSPWCLVYIVPPRPSLSSAISEGFPNKAHALDTSEYPRWPLEESRSRSARPLSTPNLNSDKRQTHNDIFHNNKSQTSLLNALTFQ